MGLLPARSTLWLSTSTPLTSSTSSNSEGSLTSTSKKRIGMSSDTWLLSSRCSASLEAYSSASVGEEVDLLASTRFVDEPLSCFVKLYPFCPELGRAPHLRDERGDDGRPDEEQSYLYTVGSVEDISPHSIKEHEGDQPENKYAQPRSPAHGGERYGDGGRGHHRQDTGSIGSSLGVHAGLEDNRDRECDGGVDQHQRPDRPRPFGRHAIAGQVAGDYVQKTRHRGRPREPQDRDRTHVVNRAERDAQLLV